MPASARYGRRAALVIVTAGVVYALVAHFALLDFPFSGDEYSTVLQAEGFARGALKAKAPPYADWVAVDHVVIDDFVRSKYPPGTAALLALGVKAGVPWLVTPLEAALTLLLVWLTVRAILDERRAFLAVAFLAAAPLFAYQAATFLSHTATLLFAALATAALSAWARNGRRLLLVGLGACVGCMFLIRPVDGLLFGFSLFALGSFPAVLLAGASALPMVLLSCWYNKLQFGSFLTDGYRAYLPAYIALYGKGAVTSSISLLHAVSPEQIYHHLAVIETFLCFWTLPGSALIAALGWVALRRQANPRSRPEEIVTRFFATLTIVMLAVLIVTYSNVDDSPRPRYLSILLLPLAYFAAAGWQTAAGFVREQLGTRAARLVAVLLWISPAFLIASYLELRLPSIVVRAGLSKEIERQHLTSGAVLVRAEWPARYARNGMFFDRPPLLLSVPASVTPDEVGARFPAEPIYEAIEPHGDNPWKHPWIVRRVK